MIQFILFVQAVPAESQHHQFVLFFGAKKRTKRSIHPLQGLPLYGEDATAPPVALTLWYPQGIKALG